MPTFTVEASIYAPVKTVWTVLADIGAIAQWNPGVTRSYLTTPEAVGLHAQRHCDLGSNKYLTEQVVEWDVEQRLTFRVVNTNLPFKTADIRFTLRSAGEATIVTVSPHYTLNFGVLGILLDHLVVRRSYAEGMQHLLTGLKQYIEGNARSTAEHHHAAQQRRVRGIQTYAEHDGLLQTALRANSIFSGVCGTALIAAAHPITDLLGLRAPSIMVGIGMSLVCFAGTLWYLARQPTAYRRFIATAIWLDVLWVIGTSLLMVAGAFSTAGTWLVAIVADVVLLFAILQGLGLRRLRQQHRE